MSVSVFLCRLFGGRDLAVSYDNGAGTLSILGQSLTISSLSSTLQSQWTAAIGGASSGYNIASANGPFRPSFGGDNISSVIGTILDAQPTWRTAIMAALATVTPEVLQP